MKVICEKTGIELLTCTGLTNFKTVSHHPIFDVRLTDLLELAISEVNLITNWQDKKLVMLAMAHNCQLLTWGKERFKATPSPQVVCNSLIPLTKLAIKIEHERYCKRFVEYPSLNISCPETARMSNFADLLNETLFQVRTTKLEDTLAEKLKKLERAAFNLSGMLKTGNSKKLDALLRTTAEWALAVTEEYMQAEVVTFETRKDWFRMLVTSPSNLKAANFSINDVKELRDFMIDYLPHGSIIAHDVLAHLNNLVECNIINEIDLGDIYSAKIVVANSENKLEEIEEPKRAAFRDSLSYSIAKAGWLIANMNKEKAAKQLLAATNNKSNNDEGI